MFNDFGSNNLPSKLKVRTNQKDVFSRFLSSTYAVHVGHFDGDTVELIIFRF